MGTQTIRTHPLTSFVRLDGIRSNFFPVEQMRQRYLARIFRRIERLGKHLLVIQGLSSR